MDPENICLPFFSHQRIAQRAVQTSFEKQLDPRGPADSRGGSVPEFLWQNYGHFYTCLLQQAPFGRPYKVCLNYAFVGPKMAPLGITYAYIGKNMQASCLEPHGLDS